MPTLCFSECESLGLLITRMPHFSQLFFYKPTAAEAALSLGQPDASTALILAARWYLKSGTQFQSKCGISDVLYHYLNEKSADPKGLAMQSSPSYSVSHPMPSLSPPQLFAIRETLSWPDHPTRPHAKQHETVRDLKRKR